jgi:small subunit ribosomal protein S2
MKEYIFGERNGIYIIDLQKTLKMFKEAAKFVAALTAEGKTVLFVGTKRQAQEAVAEEATRCGMYYVNQRWLGGLLTNMTTVQKSIKRLKQLAEMAASTNWEGRLKKEIVRLERERKHLEQNLAGIKDMPGLPDCLFVVDSSKEEIAVKEARKLGIPVVGIVDTNCDPDMVDRVIPGNDDALRAIRLFTSRIADAVLEGKDSALQKQMEQEKIAAERAAEELEAARQAAALTADEMGIVEGDFAGGAEAGAPADSFTAVRDAEEVADGRVRVPKIKRRGGRADEGNGETPAPGRS